jgi:hypothetical protein
MSQSNPSPSASPIAFATVVLSAIGLSAGLLILISDILDGNSGQPRLAFFHTVRWLSPR